MDPGTDENPILPGFSRTHMPTQFGLYLIVGGLSFLADFVVFLRLLPAGTGVAVIIGFCVGTATNYVLSRWLAFSGGRFGRRSEIIRLTAVALVGVALTLLIIMGLMRLGLGSVAAKIIATPIALGWNYLARRWFVFYHEMPEKTWATLSRLGQGSLQPHREPGDG